MKHEPNRTENLIDSQLERESFPDEFHPNNMEFVYDTRPCYRLGCRRPSLEQSTVWLRRSKDPIFVEHRDRPLPPWRKALLLLRRVAANLRLNMSGSGESGGRKKRSLPSSFSDHGNNIHVYDFFFQFICDNFMNSMSQSNIW